jgi:Na+/melibiose symporter-like transporter
LEVRVTLSTTVRASYAVGSVATGIFSTVPGLLLMYYQTETLAVPPLLAGLALSLAKLWDAVIDPTVGWLTDRTATASGRRRPWLLAGALTLPLAFFALFSAPTTTPQASFAWVLGWCAVSATCFSLFSVPYVTMPAEMSDDPDDTTRLVGWRMAALTVGILAGGAIAPALIHAGGGGRPGHAVMAGALAVVLGVTMLATWYGTASAPFDPHPSDPNPPFADLTAALRNRPFMHLLASLCVQVTGIGLLLAGVPYYARYVLGGDNGTVTVLFVCLVLPAAVAMPAWLAVARRVGRTRAYLGSLAVLAVASAGLGALGLSGTPSTAAPIVAVLGVGYAGSQIFPFAMLPDTQRAESAATGARREGTMTGVWLLGDQAALALGAFLAGAILSATGFVEGGGDQSADAVRGVLWVMSWAPMALFVAAFGVSVGLRDRLAA